MRFRPCIDIHNGKVKQIVGGSLKDAGDEAATNFASEYGADFYAEMYRRDGLSGGHIILLNPPSSEYYEATKAQAMKALSAYPGGMQIGGGIRADNAEEYLRAGASHVIVTSYVFKDGEIKWENLDKLRAAVGKEHIVIDVSCRKKEDGYYIVTDRWQKFTNVKLTREVLEELSEYCDEFLVHGVDVEGKAHGIETDLAKVLADYTGAPKSREEKAGAKNPVTYAGGIGSMADLEELRRIGKGCLDFTIGSALDLFGGGIAYKEISRWQ